MFPSWRRNCASWMCYAEPASTYDIRPASRVDPLRKLRIVDDRCARSAGSVSTAGRAEAFGVIGRARLGLCFFAHGRRVPICRGCGEELLVEPQLLRGARTRDCIDCDDNSIPSRAGASAQVFR